MVEKVHQNVLVVSERSDSTRAVLEVLAGRGIRGIVARDVDSAMDLLDRCDCDMLVTDRRLADGEEFELLRKVRDELPEMPVVLLEAPDEDLSAGEHLPAGRPDVVVHSLQRESLEEMVDTLLPNHRVVLAAADQEDARCLYQIAGRSAALRSVVDLACRVAPTSVPVLVEGESGTGKELIAYLIHRESRRSRGPYVRVNCAALSESLLESELFGHERGAFTGACARRIGRIERAHGGTLLLDEISETTPRLQAELLRVLEQQDFERVGGSEAIRVNVRVIATTNRQLAEEVRHGRFRKDLYYRICGVRLRVPPLRERPDDVPVLVWHFVNEFAGEVRRRIAAIDPATLRLLQGLSWPGNVRQLRNVVRTAMILGAGGTLSLAEAGTLGEELLAEERAVRPGTLRLQELERQAIQEALRRTNSHQARAARLLGITDRTLREKLRRYRASDDRREEECR